MFLYVGTDKPTVEILNNYVKDKVAQKWYDLGEQLLSTEPSEMLDMIKQHCPTNDSLCCAKMFDKWLNVDVEASWDKLMAALEHIDRTTLAENIRRKDFKFKGMCVCMHISIGKLLWCIVTLIICN